MIKASGFDVTQATLSRDIRELGLVKGGSDGAYQPQGKVEANGHTAKAMLQRALAATPAHRSRAAARAAADRPGTCPVVVRSARQRGAPGRRRNACRRRHDSHHHAGRTPRADAGEGGSRRCLSG